MTIFQQYYTSFRHPTDPHRAGGFGIQAETQGIPDSAQAMIDKTIGYRIPRSLSPDALNEHPVALRFQAINGQAILACVQSCGKDELGRDGNYFAHTLIGSTEEITGSMPPIFYWKSNFWVGRDESHYDSLPSLASMDALSLRFDPNKLWDFIQQGNRRTWLHQLLCAVIDFARSKRTIIILDTNDAIAQWIACVTMAFPPVYHSYLSFATYHHDPYTAPFMLIGTTSDSGFRFSTDEYVRYFVLNAEAGRVSDAPPSDYADFVAQRFNPDRFNSEIVNFFEWQSEYAFARQGIGATLNDQINFRQATFYQTLPRESEQSVRAASLIIEENQAGSLSVGRLNDLRAALDIIYTAALDNSTALNEYIRAAQILKAVDRDFAQVAPNTALLLSQLILQKRADDAGLLLRQSESLYGAEVFAGALRTPAVLDLLAQRLDQQDIQQHTLLWKVFDKRLNASLAQMPNVQALLFSTFAALEELDRTALPMPDAARDMMTAILNGASMNDFANVLQLAAQLKQRRPSNLALEWLYYVRVENLSLKARHDQGYWRLWNTFPLYTFELNADLARAGRTDDVVTTIANWCGTLSPESSPQVITGALDFLWSQSRIAKRDLARVLLLHPTLESKVPPDWKQKLIEILLADAAISVVDERTGQLYERFLAANLSPALLGAMEGSLALFKQSLTEGRAARIQGRLDAVDEKKYREEATKLIAAFFVTPKNTASQHWLLVFATYTSKHKHVFWELYWGQLRTALLEERRTDPVAGILDLWFKHISQLEERFPMIVPEFFLELPEILSSIRDAKSFHHVERDFERSLSRFPWHPLIGKYLSKSRRGLLNLF